jgi:hypothetical protein
MLTRCKFFCRASRHWLRRDWGVRIDARKGVIMDHLREQALRSALRPVKEPPRLWRLNGCGTTMMGRYFDPEMAPAQFYSLVWFTFILIPISPMGIYLVSQSRGSYRFYGAIEKKDFNALYRHGYGWSACASALAFTLCLSLWLMNKRSIPGFQKC